MASNIKDLGKIKAKKKKNRKKRWREKNNWLVFHSYKNYLASLFLDLINQVFPQYIWILVIPLGNKTTICGTTSDSYISKSCTIFLLKTTKNQG